MIFNPFGVSSLRKTSPLQVNLELLKLLLYSGAAGKRGKIAAIRPGKEHAVKLKVLIYAAEEGGYWAKVPAIPGCVSQGETLEEVKANILDALEGCRAVREEMALQEAPAVEELEV